MTTLEWIQKGNTGCTFATGTDLRPGQYRSERFRQAFPEISHDLYRGYQSTICRNQI
jgi:hypothetical protein